MDRRPLPLRHLGRRAAAVFGVCLVAAAVSASAFTATVTGDQKKLPPGTLRGPIDRLQQYPTLSLATAEQRAAAVRLLEATRSATRKWRDSKAAAAAAGFRMTLAPGLQLTARCTGSTRRTTTFSRTIATWTRSTSRRSSMQTHLGVRSC